MELNWHKIGLQCCHCHNEPIIVSLSVSADSTIMLDLHCLQCDIPLQWKSNFASLICRSYNADLMAHRATQKAQKIEPPKPEKPLGFTIKDVSDLHRMGIKCD